MGSFEFFCPACHKAVAVPDAARGEKLPCPHCGAQIRAGTMPTGSRPGLPFQERSGATPPRKRRVTEGELLLAAALAVIGLVQFVLAISAFLHAPPPDSNTGLPLSLSCPAVSFLAFFLAIWPFGRRLIAYLGERKD
jgi:hypothetical protein